MAGTRKSRRGTLLLGLLLVAAGSLFFIAPSSSAANWIVRLWPVFLICAGVARVMGFAVERKPRTPIGGLLLVVVGLLFLVSRFHPDLNAIEIYGRYWVLLLIAFGAVEVVRYYSHKPGYGATPKMFTVARLLIVIIIVVSGVAANRVGRNRSLLASLHLGGLMGGVRDSLVGQSYAYTDDPITAPLKTGKKVTIDNRYGSIRVIGGSQTLRATLAKKVSAWDETEARKTAQQIKIAIRETDEGLLVTTNRAELDGSFITDIQVELPQWTPVTVVDSYGTVLVSNIQSAVSTRVSHGDVRLNSIEGDVSADLNYSDFAVADVTGDVKATGFKKGSASNIRGEIELAGKNGSVELRNIVGPVHVEAPLSKITCQDLSDTASIKTERGSVEINGSSDINIEAPYSDVRISNVRGDATVSSSHGSIKLTSVDGDLEVTAEEASVTAEDIRGESVIQTTRGDVILRGFRESVRVETSYRDVTLVPSGIPSADIEVTNNHGGIKLFLPSQSHFQLDASSQGGKVRSIGFNGLAGQNDNAVLFGTIGPTIKLRTSYKDVIIQANGSGQVEASAVVN